MASFAATAEAAPHENHTTTLESFISLPAYLLPPEGAAELAETSITPVGGGGESRRTGGTPNSFG